MLKPSTKSLRNTLKTTQRKLSGVSRKNIAHLHKMGRKSMGSKGYASALRKDFGC